MERIELKRLVPRGYGKLIAQRAGTNQMTVSRFLNGKNNCLAIELATLELLAELTEKKQSLVCRIKGKSAN